ncbi:MAG: hypothetical protein IPK10_09050 [Bacteroidetes bacterium]|nr:hypothetical protein [Bacteroidota bacterium]
MIPFTVALAQEDGSAKKKQKKAEKAKQEQIKKQRKAEEIGRKRHAKIQSKEVKKRWKKINVVINTLIHLTKKLLCGEKFSREDVRRISNCRKKTSFLSAIILMCNRISRFLHQVLVNCSASHDFTVSYRFFFPKSRKY